MSFGQVRGAVVQITSRPPVVSFRTTASFSWKASPRDVASTLCSLDGGQPVACASFWRYSGLGAGSHRFRVTAFDGSGAVVGGASVGWTIQRIRR